MFKPLFIFAACLLVVNSFYAQKLEPKEIAKALCSEEFHGRGYVSKGDSLAAQLIAAQFAEYGVKPLKSKSYFQHYSFPVNSFPKAMSVMVGQQNLTPGRDFIVSPSSGSFKGQLKLETLDRGTLETPEALNKLLDRLHENEQNNVGILVNSKGITKDTLMLLNQLIEELNNYFPIIELYSDKFTWSISQKTNTFPHVYLRENLYSQGKVISLDIENKFIENYSSQNVIGYIPSKRWFCRKYVFLTAHYDHLGRMGEATYFPGANDNASGTAILFGLADRFLKKRSKYNVVFIAFSGEEVGLLGSRYYTDHPTVPLKKIKFLLNLDIMGSGEEGVTLVNGSVFKQEFDELVEINKENQLLTTVNARGKAANSDHYFFTERGVKSMFMYTMGPNKNYHDIDDQFEKLSFAEFEDLQKLIELFVRQL
ncbi:MAG: M28 family peptidase [Bacteroidetes bacterium]|nr:M28 family peptidase [Bacteroidota bacterium]